MKRIIALALVAIMMVAMLASCGGNSYSKLAIVDLGLEKEFFGIAFRTGSDMTRKVEEITVELINEGKLAEWSTTYEVGAMGKDEYVPKAAANEGAGDWDYIKGKGKLVVGVTVYKPMDYQDEKGEWIGFDADYARAVAEKLGVDVEFKKIEWDYKLIALESKDIDCIWNGMTITDDIEAAADCTVPYMYNTQVAVVKKENADKYKAIADFAGKTIAVEDGSAGADVVKNNDTLKDGYKGVTAQVDALMEVLTGASDAAVVDLTLAKALIK